VNTGTAIGLAGIPPNLGYEPQKAPVFSGAIRGLAAHPAIIATSADVEYIGHLYNGK